MVKERMDLLELLRKGGMDGDVDFLRWYPKTRQLAKRESSS